MASYQAAIRTGIHQILQDAQNAHQLVINNFSSEETYYPTSRLEDMGKTVEVKITTMGITGGRERVLRNPRAKPLEIGVMIHVQKRVEPTDIAAIDTLLELTEQLMELCEDDEIVLGYNWLRTEPLKDENEVPYSYEALTVNGVFQAVFVVYYTYILQGE
jgi:hypothetical protein